MGRYIFGIDLGGTSVKMGLLENEDLLETWQIPTNKDNQGANVLSEIAESVYKKALERKIAPADIIGIGIAVPGPVADGNVVTNCVNIGWKNMAVSDKLAACLADLFDAVPTDFRVKTANDANAAALGEMWKGGGRGVDSIVMLTLGTGIGGGVVIGGKILAGSHGAGGEIGHMLCVAQKDISGACGCGRKGCLEQVASATGFVNYAKLFLKRTDQASVLRDKLEKEGEIFAHDVTRAAEAGDAVAMEIFDNICHYLGKAMANIAVVSDPECFVIGGGVSAAGEFLRRNIERHYKESAFFGVAETKIELAELGNDAGVYGAACMVKDLD